MSRCFIIGGGSSLRGILEDSPTKLRLDKEILWGCNKAVDYFNCNYMVFFDPDFYIKHRHTVDNFKGDGGIFAPTTFNEDVAGITKIELKDIGHGIYGGRNCGTLATSLAISMGFKEIYLLGIDLGYSDDKTRSHFHDDYTHKATTDPSLLGEDLYESFCWNFYMLGKWVKGCMPEVKLGYCIPNPRYRIDVMRDYYNYTPLSEVLSKQ